MTVNDGKSESTSGMDVLLGPGDDIVLTGRDLGVAQKGERFFIFKPSPGGVYWSGPAGSSIEESQTLAFGNEGGGLPLPPALALRRSADLDNLVGVLSQGAMRNVTVRRLDHLVVDGVSLARVEAEAETGFIRLEFDRDSGLLRSADATLTPPGEGGEQRFVTHFQFQPRPIGPGEPLPPFDLQMRAPVEKPSDVVELSGPRLGEMATAPELETTKSEAIKLSDLRGHIVVLDFWSTWCGPCRASSEQVERTRRLALAEGLDVVFFGVNTLETGDAETRRERISRWWKDAAFEFETLVDLNGEFAEELRIGNLPTIVVVGKDGRIEWAHVGFSDDIGDALLLAIRAAKDRS